MSDALEKRRKWTKTCQVSRSHNLMVDISVLHQHGRISDLCQRLNLSEPTQSQFCRPGQQQGPRHSAPVRLLIVLLPPHKSHTHLQWPPPSCNSSLVSKPQSPQSQAQPQTTHTHLRRPPLPHHIGQNYHSTY